MAYTTLAALVERFGSDMIRGLTDRATPPAGAIDESVVAKAISDAEAVINGRLGVRFVVPLSETPPEIADIALSIAIWKLHTFAPGKKIEDDYHEAMMALRDMAKGLVTLNAATIAPATTGGTGARMTDRERPFTEENMRGFI